MDSDLNRRQFLAGAAGAAALSASVLQSSPTHADEAMATNPTPGGTSGGGPSGHDDDVAEVSIGDLQSRMTSGEATSQSLTEEYLDRIERVDRNGPTVNSVLAVNPDAVDIAAALDKERANGNVRGPLHGIPVLLKDNVDTGDNMATTAGSLALNGSRATQDAHVAKRLRDAGCVLLGKSNLSEWANFRSERSSSGWSGVGGQTRNPYALDRNPCGSSSGSGAAVAASLCAAAIGTETDGSVVCPSNANGIVGIKPTLGLVSRTGIVPIAHSQDTVGPMARTVADAAAILTAIVGQDPADRITSAASQHGTDYTQHLQDDGLRGARLGVARNYMGFHEQCDALLEDALVAMREGGADLVDPVEVPNRGDYSDAEYEVLLYEFKAGLNTFLARRGHEGARSLAEVIDFNRNHAERSMPYFQQEILEKAQEKGDLKEDAYLKARADSQRMAGPEGIDATLAKHSLDAIVAITGGPAWPTDLVTGDHFLGGCSQPAAVSGYAHITVPMGHVFGLPVNVSFFSGAFSEPTLIRVAYAFEQITQVRQAPQYLPTANLDV